VKKIRAVTNLVPTNETAWDANGLAYGKDTILRGGGGRNDAVVAEGGMDSRKKGQELTPE